MAENLSCEETSDSWITDDNDDEINCSGGFLNEIDYYTRNELFIKDDNFHGSIPMMTDSQSLLREERISEMLEREVEFLPGTDYLKRLRSGNLELLVRNKALDWIIKVCAHYNFGPVCICLSLSYLDRFLTCYEFPKDKAWAVQLLALSCLSLAAKMEETDVPQTVDLQVEDPKFVFEAKMIKRMELMILNTLSWRLQALTPFSFIDYFINKISGQVSVNSMYKSSQFILNTIKDIDFLDFRPSEIAAAAAVSVSISGETNCIYDHICVKQERVKGCLNMMRSVREESVVGARFWPVPESPIGVLEATCLSHKSEKRRVESCTNSSESSPENSNTNKRRRKQ